MKKISAILIFMSATCLALFTNCSSSSESGLQQADSLKYFQLAPKVVVHAYYETGAAPFTGADSGRTLWNILEDNLVSIFQYRSSPPTLVVPKTLSEMTALPAQSRSSWTSTDIKNFHATYGAQNLPQAEGHFHVYFVRGYFNDGSGPKTGVIGVSIGGTTVVAIFKDVVDASGGGVVQRYVEQSTIVHELGHALGFVNNGVPLTSAHQDTAHGAHSTDSDCVMYWANEGAADLQAYVVRYLTSSSKVMWGPKVLADAQGISR